MFKATYSILLLKTNDLEVFKTKLMTDVLNRLIIWLGKILMLVDISVRLTY